MDLHSDHKGVLCVAQEAHVTLGHLESDATYIWAYGRGVDLTTKAIAQVIH